VTNRRLGERGVIVELLREMTAVAYSRREADMKLTSGGKVAGGGGKGRHDFFLN